MALHKHATVDGYLKKKDLQELAQPYADVSFCQTDVVNAQYYSAWSAMTTLINKELVDKKGNPAKYELTESGKSLACRLDRAESELQSSSASKAINPNYVAKSPAKSDSPVKANTKGVAKAPRVRKANAQTKPTTVRDVDIPTTSAGILQPNDLILIDDDEFDRYAQQSVISNSNGRNFTAKPSEPAFPQEEIVVEEEPEPYAHIRDKVTLKAGEYDIILCVDIAEVSGYGL